MTKSMREAHWVVLAVAAAAMAWHGPIAQLADYHAFADTRTWLGVPHAGDVISNAAFALVVAWALWTRPTQGTTNPGERSAADWFLASLALTTLGSTWYHLAPDNARLIFDRLPIALACAALLCQMHARTTGRDIPAMLPAMLVAAVGSVVWWWRTEAMGAGDLRPYLLLQFAPLVLVPLWQWQYGRPRQERIDFAVAIGLYVLAKVLELADHAVLEALGIVSGHALKHVAAAVAAIFIIRSARGRGAA